MTYEVLFYNDRITPAVYYPLGTVRGKTPEDALLKNLPKLLKRLRRAYPDIDWLPDEKLERDIYLVSGTPMLSVIGARLKQEEMLEEQYGKEERED